MHANTRSLHLLGGLFCLTVIIVLICTFLPSWKHGGGDNGKQSIEEEIKTVLGGRLRSLPTGVPGFRELRGGADEVEVGGEGR